MRKLIKDNFGIWTNHQKNKSSYPLKGHDECFSIEDNSFWFKHRNNVLLSIIDKFPFLKSFCDIGGGNGFQLKHIQDKYPELPHYLVEPGYQGCLNSKKRGISNIYNMTSEYFPFDQFPIGGVGLFDVLEHIEDDYGFICKLKNSLSANTLLYLTVPANTNLWSATDVMSGHFRRYTYKTLDKLVSHSRLKMLYFSYFFSFLVVPIFITRRLPYLLDPKPNLNKLLKKETRNLDQGPLVDKIMTLYSQMELRTLIKKRIQYGTSCVAVIQI